jgi:hypothetical protein
MQPYSGRTSWEKNTYFNCLSHTDQQTINKSIDQINDGQINQSNILPKLVADDG